MPIIIVLSLLGLIGIISPKASWYISNWWKFDGDAEPSRVSLLLYRMGGIVFLIISFIMYRSMYG
ncbi:DUF6199 family natural product biosynthesis protein [Paenibacillus eucommiae]|uniref:DUF6199 domain-containing protein n=1 Tax=Paenibacillus eucommiae TaxID=1355755 RepID=A0ABS4J3Z8_9BACL|nr:DUF6199 family natural product biosynthesis protein [Paenibacillus eucommiae]MBP1994564.1 hypothetical protein [Paenibacillus eucommiae]